ncbi:MAG: Rrf2 family transcriptional regulator [Opitutaceae bacterium]|nr:Rrf2 family transcriptional regulator [Opitutaceae bacterium]
MIYIVPTMNLSKRGEYGLRAMIDMAIAHELGRDLLQLSELAESEKIPVKFLEQILLALKQGGFLESMRGKYGGYRLARPAREIIAGRIVRHLDGPLAPIGCVSQTAYEKCSCPDETHCGLRMLMLDVRNAISNILDRYTLADVAGVALRKMRADNVNLPFVASPHVTGARDGKPKTRRPGASEKPSPLTTPFETGLGEFLYREGI